MLNQTELALVDYHVLQRPLGHLDFLAGLMNREVHESEAADVVVVMGPQPHFTDRIPQGELENQGGAPLGLICNTSHSYTLLRNCRIPSGWR